MGIKDVGAAALKLIGVDPVAIIDKTADIVDKYVQTQDEKAALGLELAKLKNEEAARALDVERERMRLEYEDTKSARSIRGIGEYIQSALAIIFTLFFFGLIFYIFFIMKGAGLSSEQVNMVYLIFGAVSGIEVTIIGFFFGSSAGSKGKDDIIKRLQDVAPAKDNP